MNGASAAPEDAGAEQRTDVPTGDQRERNLDDIVEAHATPVTDVALPDTHEGGGTATYLIEFDAAAVPLALHRQAAADGADRGPLEAVPDREVDRVADGIRAQQETDKLNIARAIGHAPEVVFDYQFAVNGIAVELTADEAVTIAKRVPGIRNIALDTERELHTDAGPGLINADEVWADVSSNPDGFKGEGVVIGVIDTGISPGNDSFADPAPGDGYNHTNPRGTTMYGACDPGNTEQYDPALAAMCNDKLIGMYDFVTPGGSPVDVDGHGSHTASTAGGNVVNGVTAAGIPQPLDISGVAPHANIISYFGCCTVSGLTASIEQAILDDVDVINYSIGAPAPSPDAWADFDSVGFLNARAAGIFVATSNGNEGPGYATTGSPADVPWLISVGASTHGRYNQAALTDLTDGTTSWPDIVGKGATDGLAAPVEIFDAATVGDALCQDATGHDADFGGKIVLCDRGTNGRVEKSENVAAQGAIGFILANDEPNNLSLLGDDYAVPGVFISHDDGIVLRDHLAAATGPVTAGIQATTYVVDDAAYADVLASFSSRGPNGAMDLISPNVTAPGVDILAAVADDTAADGGNVHNFISGTSMASPHVAGAGALMTQALAESGRDWSPAEMQSALMTTASPTVLNHDLNPADPYQQGSGRIDVAAALQAGLLFDVAGQEYIDADPKIGGDVRTLNLPSMADTQCLGSCAWQRTAESSLDVESTWTATVVTDTGLTVDVTLGNGGVVAPDGELTIDVNADVTGAPIGEVLFGRITLSSDVADVPDATLPIAVLPSDSVLPPHQFVDTRRNTGSVEVGPNRIVATPDLQTSLAGWTKGDTVDGELLLDPTNGEPFDDLSQVDVHTVTVPAGTARLVGDVVDTTIADLDLFIGTGTTPSEATLVCTSATGTAFEYCDLPTPAAGDYWVLVQNWDGSDDPAAPDTYSLNLALVGADESNGTVEAPPSVGTGEEFDATVTWNIPGMVEGDTYYGAALLGDSAMVPIDLARHADDVAKTASVTEAAIGETIDYDISIESNVRQEGLVYTVTDIVPDGLEIDPASVTNGGVVDGQTITWTVDMPTLSEAPGTYAVTDFSDPACADFGEYLDLGTIPISLQSGLFSGTNTQVSAFPGIDYTFYNQASTGLVMNEDGFMYPGDFATFADTATQTVPDPADPNGLLALLWADLEEGDTDAGLRIATSGTTAIVQYEGFEHNGQPVGNFQVWWFAEVGPGAEMFVLFDDPGTLPAAATIGVESPDGSTGAAVINNADPTPLFEFGNGMCADWLPPTGDATQLSYSVTVTDAAAPGVATNQAAHITDNYADAEAVATADVTIADAPATTVPDTTVPDTTTPPTTTPPTTTPPTTTPPTTTPPTTTPPTTTPPTTVPPTTVPEPEDVDVITPVDPGRFWDTRSDGETVDGEHEATGRLPGGESYTVQVAGRGDVPDNAVGVVANLTAILPDEPGFATMYPCDGEVPLASNVNYFPGDVLPNNNVVPLDDDGQVCVYTLADADYALDVNGFVPDGSELTGISPARYLDTRDGESTFDGESEGGGPLAADDIVEVQIAGRGDVADDAGTALLNLTVADPAGAGYLTMYPCTDEVPTASTVNYLAGEFRANGVVADLSDDGTVCVYSKADADVIIDVSGFVPEGADGLGGITPARLLDTREGDGPTTAEGVIEVQVTGEAGVPDTATAAVLNLAVVEPETLGYATIFPCTDEVPTASNVNHTEGVDFVANNAITKLSPEGTVCIFTKSSTDLVLDVGGWLE